MVPKVPIEITVVGEALGETRPVASVNEMANTPAWRLPVLLLSCCEQPIFHMHEASLEHQVYQRLHNEPRVTILDLIVVCGLSLIDSLFFRFHFTLLGVLPVAILVKKAVVLPDQGSSLVMLPRLAVLVFGRALLKVVTEQFADEECRIHIHICYETLAALVVAKPLGPYFLDQCMKIVQRVDEILLVKQWFPKEKLVGLQRTLYMCRNWRVRRSSKVEL